MLRRAASRLGGLFALLTLAGVTSSLPAPNSALASVAVPSAGTNTPLAATHQVMGQPVSESLGTIMARDRLAGPQPASAAPARRSPSNRASLPPNPGSSRVAATPDRQSASRAALPSVAQTTGTQLLGAQLSESGAVPPDSMGAVGPSQFIVMVNGRIKSFNKSTGAVDGVLNSSTDSFFASVRHGLPTSDPRVHYDRLSGRWFFTMITAAFPNHVLIAYSDTSTITVGQIHFLFYDVNLTHPGCLWDYDTLGVDQNALYIGGNLYCGLSPGTFAGTRGLVMPKAAVLAGGAVPVTEFFLGDNGASCGGGGDGVFTPQGVDNYDPASTVGYFAGTSLCVFGRLTFARISDPGGTPTGVALRLTVAPTMFPSAVPAMGSNHPLDAVDDRLFAAHLRNGHLWTAHNLCVDNTGTAVPNSCPAGSRDGSRWYDITNLDATPTLNQSGTVFDPAVSNPRNYWIPSVMVSGQGHVAMGTSVAGTSEHAEAATMGRLGGDAPGAMQAATIYQASTFVYNAQANPMGGIQRWGDFSYTSLDPNDDMTMWTIQEFTNATDSWGVEAVQLKAPPPATPASVAGGPFVANQQCSQVVKVTGTSSNGSGFFDPGAGFANRLQARISGGVTVNSVSYVDPTHITLDVSTLGAAAGMKDLTVTNPDGQVVAASNFLSLVAGGNCPGFVAGGIGSDNGLWVFSNSSGFSPRSGRLLGAPAIASVLPVVGPAKVLYFGTGLDHNVWVRSDGQDWQQLASTGAYCIDNPAATVTGSPGSTTLFVAREGRDQSLWYAVGAVGAGSLPTLSGWAPLGGRLTAGPAVASVNGTVTFFVLGADYQVWTRDLSSGYQPFGAHCLGHPAVATSSIGTSYFSCHGLDGGLWYATNSGGGWSGAQSPGGHLVDGPGIAAVSGSPDFFVEGTDQSVWDWSPARGWSPDGGRVQYGVAAVSS